MVLSFLSFLSDFPTRSLTRDWVRSLLVCGATASVQIRAVNCTTSVILY
jgi:hypothetical protein